MAIIAPCLCDISVLNTENVRDVLETFIANIVVSQRRSVDVKADSLEAVESDDIAQQLLDDILKPLVQGVALTHDAIPVLWRALNRMRVHPAF